MKLLTREIQTLNTNHEWPKHDSFLNMEQGKVNETKLCHGGRRRYFTCAGNQVNTNTDFKMLNHKVYHVDRITHRGGCMVISTNREENNNILLQHLSGREYYYSKRAIWFHHQAIHSSSTRTNGGVCKGMIQLRWKDNDPLRWEGLGQNLDNQPSTKVHKIQHARLINQHNSVVST